MNELLLKSQRECDKILHEYRLLLPNGTKIYLINTDTATCVGKEAHGLERRSPYHWFIVDIA
jgi:hypothetical protein